MEDAKVARVREAPREGVHSRQAGEEGGVVQVHSQSNLMLHRSFWCSCYISRWKGTASPPDLWGCRCVYPIIPSMILTLNAALPIAMP